jgi:hypothetical protein
VSNLNSTRRETPVPPKDRFILMSSQRTTAMNVNTLLLALILAAPAIWAQTRLQDLAHAIPPEPNIASTGWKCTSNKWTR